MKDEPAKLSAPRAQDLAASEPVPAEVVSSRSEAGAERAGVASGEDLELANAIWIEGRVVFPPETPTGERVRVVATGRKFKSRGPHSAEVQADGRFRVAFAEKTRIGWLQLDASHLYIASHKVEIGKLAGEVVLEPKVGGRIAGRIVPPNGEDDAHAALAEAQVRLQGYDFGAGEYSQVARTSAIGKDLRFELRGVPPGVDLDLQCAVRGWVPASLEDLRATALETLEVELVFSRGARLTGRITDEGGGDLADARLFVVASGEDVHFFGQSAHKPAADGSFDLQGLPPGDLKLVARMSGRADAEVELGEVADGARIQDLGPRLTLGGALEGQVVWDHDGEPAPKARVFALGEAEEEWDAGERTATSDAEGRFRLTGLGEGPFSLRAEARSAAGVEADRAPKISRGHAVLEAVPAGSAPVVLRLQPGLSVWGRVTDDTGAAVTAFHVQAALEDDSFSFRGMRNQRFRSEDGRFELTGLREGRWTLGVQTPRHGGAEESVDVPGDGRELAFVLPRSASLSGTVLGLDGRPLAKARVAFKAGEHGGSSSTTADAEGRFTARQVAPGKVELWAEAEGLARDTPVELQLAPGQEVEGLVLHVRRGSRLTGELVPSLTPREGHRISAWSAGVHRSTTSDSSGRFELQGLPPGNYHVMLQGQGSSGRGNRAEVTIVAGADAHVVLGQAVVDPIRLSGTVRSSRGPLAGASVNTWRKVGPGAERSHSQGETDAQGQYTLVIDGPGEYHVSMEPSGGGTTITREVVVPEVKTWRVDFELSGGALRGRVVDSAGKPQGHSSIRLEATSGGGGGHLWTSSNGTFAFEDVPEGSYALIADPGWSRGRSTHAAVRREGFHVSGRKEIDGIELRLPKAGSIEGTVSRPDGSPAARVQVAAFAADAADGHDESMTDSAGRYTLRGLAPGRWRVSASDGESLASHEGPLLTVDGDLVRHDLALRHGTRILLRVEDPQGALVHRFVTVSDSQGRDYSHRRLHHASAEDPIHIGPLPPGTYTLRLHNEAQTSTRVTLSGEAERTVTLKLPAD